MPLFDYVTKDYQGNSHKGEVEAKDASQAAALLRTRRQVIITIKPKNEFQEEFIEKTLHQISFAEIVVITRQLATMISSGLILSESLDILAEQQPNPRLKKVLTAISSDIKGGLDFASSLEKYPEVFPNIYSKLIRAGQVSGKLDAILNQLADSLEKERAFKSKVKGAMVYPILVVCMMVGVSMVMVFFVVPRLTSLYAESGIELPITTKILLAITGFFLNFWWLILILVVVGVISAQRYISTPTGRLNFDSLMLRIPFVSKIVNLVVLTNFTRTFALLSSSGISILDSIKIVGSVCGNKVYENALDSAYLGVERGLTFSNQILAAPVFPKLVGQMIKTGEETGKLDAIMFKLADYFESEADNSLKTVTTVIEPVILVILGVGVAFLVISIIMPIYQLTTNIK